MKKLHELINLFLENGYSWEQIEFTYQNYYENNSKIEESTINQIVEALEEEQSNWS